ncbi:MAG: 8-oxo-dGTP diphosphatase [Nitrososphaerales archaeon]
MSFDYSQLNPTDTIRAVLCYLKRDDKYLLLLKVRGKFGGGFWNAPGGKIETGETPEKAVIREVMEETGLHVKKLEKAGFLEFYFGQGKQRPDWTAEVFTSSDFSGNQTASEEGTLRWFSEDDLPVDQMWQDDRYWLPLLVKGIKFRGVFEFTSNSEKLVSYKIERSSSL